MKNFDHIPTTELFSDYQESQTDLFLLDLLEELTPEERKRRDTEYRTLSTIKEIMRSRFSQAEVRDFLNIGYPRQVTVRFR